MKKKRESLVGIIILVTGIIAAMGLWYWNTNKKKIIRTELDKAILKKSDGLYKVHYDSLDLDEVKGHLSVFSFTLTYDSIQYVRLKKKQKEPFLLFNIFIPEIHIAGVSTPRALVDKEIRGRHLAIINPVIEILYTDAGKDSSRTVPDREIYQQILGNLNLIKLDSVVISGAKIITKNLRTGKTLVRFTNVSLRLLDVAVDSVANADTTRLLFAKEVNLDCEKFTWQSNNKLYSYQVDDLSLRSAASIVSIKNFFIIPALKEDQFVKKFSHQINRYDVAIHNIQLRNTDLYELANEVIKTDILVLGSASFKIYRDRNMPEDKRNKVGDYPHQLIQKLPVQIEIKKAIVRNTTIEYKEKSAVTHQSGKVMFGNSSTYIANITNRKGRIAANNLMVVDMKSYLLNKVPLTARWTFFLRNPDGKFTMRGKGGPANTTVFNVLAAPMGLAQFKSGQINSMEFDLTATNHKMTGTMKLLYNDFKIFLLKKDEDSIHFKKRKIASLFANIKIKNSNPGDEDEKPRVANINLQRDIHRSVFNLVWKSLFGGVSQITGAK